MCHVSGSDHLTRATLTSFPFTDLDLCLYITYWYAFWIRGSLVDKCLLASWNTTKDRHWVSIKTCLKTHLSYFPPTKEWSCNVHVLRRQLHKSKLWDLRKTYQTSKNLSKHQENFLQFISFPTISLKSKTGLIDWWGKYPVSAPASMVAVNIWLPGTWKLPVWMSN